ncbi:MAG: histidine kinase [Roseovarius sp. BRH_c41]|uniref:PAS domain-containing protein n=1 Tax=Roseovarius sp. BRH_c41 TaxID=1629709 RepID=UPI0005F1E038|nr:PAS domain-containing protein [Roseovarius sp. BRH_c41]KJS45370.1 MAG: histidine kinase [Roseovarius sp. BRH_c41]
MTVDTRAQPAIAELSVHETMLHEVEMHSSVPDSGPRADAIVIDQDVPFGIGELFFSRTDTRGVIQAFNPVFLRVAGYSAAQLTHAPHKVIRHPDMPKGVFWLMWDGLKRGHSVGAYVKNRAKDGRFYWVFAVVSPVAGGYLSVRLKPTSPLFATVREVYARALERERLERLTPEQSAQSIEAEIVAAGFANYGAFQIDALRSEHGARETQKHAVCADNLLASGHLLDVKRQIDTELRSLCLNLKEAELITTNMKIQACKLRSDSGPINEIAKNYELMMREIRSHPRVVYTLREDRGTWEVNDEARSVFLIVVADLMAEMFEFFSVEDTGCARDGETSEVAVIAELRDRYRREADRATQESYRAVRQLAADAEMIRRMVTGLAMVRVVLRVEAGILRERLAGLQSILGQLDRFHDQVGEALERIQDAVTVLLRDRGFVA